MLGYLASFPHSSPQHEVIFKSCKDVMPLLSYLLFKDASFRVLKCTVTIGAHMQDSQVAEEVLNVRTFFRNLRRLS